MKMPIAIIIIGITMFISGLIMFYSIELGQTEQVPRLIKDTGTFVGISGMGVSLAGLLLHLINKKEPPIKGQLDT